jgi:glycosyltransferase involved in cell wall biosynthesis
MTSARAEGPLVSFIVPCYKHGHFLMECVQSILRQTYHNVEVLIMDDCSPDDTPIIAQSIRDPRVRHIRNDVNLGHLRNYNKGIALANGAYIWLINVDDYLRRPYVLERFVATLETYPTAAFVLCPAVKVHGTEETVVLGSQAATDTVFTGREFIRRLLIQNTVPTAGVMVRKASYERRGVFPLDLPHAADWYQWCNHALYGDVAYLAEPMVCYRMHELNMTKYYFAHPAALVADVMAVRWRVKVMSQRAGFRSLVSTALSALASEYTYRLTHRVGDGRGFWMTLEDFEASVNAHSDDSKERLTIKAAVFASLGDHYYANSETGLARQFYRRTLRHRPTDLRTWVKCGLLATGTIGRVLRASGRFSRA